MNKDKIDFETLFGAIREVHSINKEINSENIKEVLKSENINNTKSEYVTKFIKLINELYHYNLDNFTPNKPFYSHYMDTINVIGKGEPHDVTLVIKSNFENYEAISHSNIEVTKEGNYFIRNVNLELIGDNNKKYRIYNGKLSSLVEHDLFKNNVPLSKLIKHNFNKIDNTKDSLVFLENITELNAHILANTMSIITKEILDNYTLKSGHKFSLTNNYNYKLLKDNNVFIIVVNNVTEEVKITLEGTNPNKYVTLYKSGNCSILNENVINKSISYLLSREKIKLSTNDEVYLNMLLGRLLNGESCILNELLDVHNTSSSSSLYTFINKDGFVITVDNEGTFKVYYKDIAYEELKDTNKVGELIKKMKLYM